MYDIFISVDAQAGMAVGFVGAGLVVLLSFLLSTILPTKYP
jgi:hypothetical protein